MKADESQILDAHGRPASMTIPAQSKRSFEGARVSRLETDWHTAQTSMDHDLRWQLKRLIDRSRWFEQNSEYGEGYLKLMERNVLGPEPFTLQMKVTEPDGTHDKLAEQAIETAWKDWGRKENCDLSHSLSLSDHYRVALRAMLRDGGALIIKHTGMSLGKYAFRIEARDIDFLDPDYNVDLKNGGRIVMSVELDTVGRPIAYHLLGSHPGDTYWTSRNQMRTRVMSSRVIHPFIRTRSNQTRGFPQFAAIMPNFRQFSGYREAAVVASRIGASGMGWLTKSPGEGEQWSGDRNPNGGFYMNFEPGTVHELPIGYHYESHKPDHPQTAYSEFVKEHLRGGAAALGVSYANLANDAGDANFSSQRVHSIEEREQYKMTQRVFREHVCEDIFASWLAASLMAGAIRVPSAGREPRPIPVEKFDKMNHPVFRGRGWQWLDPRNESMAAKTDMETGVVSKAQIIAQRGGDEEEVQDEIRQSIEQDMELGLVGTTRLEAMARGRAMVAATETETKEPMLAKLGVNGMQALSMFIQQLGQGEMTPEAVMVMLKSVFGFSDADAKTIADSAKQPQQNTT